MGTSTTQGANAMKHTVNVSIPMSEVKQAGLYATQAVVMLAYTEQPEVFEYVVFESDASKVPSTGKTIAAAFRAAFDNGDKMPILKTPENCKCFLGVIGNDVYRVLHDYDHFVHYTMGLGGTTKLEDEVQMNLELAQRIAGYVKTDNQDVKIVAESCLYADLIGQAFYYANKKDFVSNEGQLAFVQWLAGAIIAGKNEGKNAIQVMESITEWPKF